MSVSVEKIAGSPDPLLTLAEQRSLASIPVRDMTNINRERDRTDHGNRPLVICVQGDEGSCHGNREPVVEIGPGTSGRRERRSGARVLRQQWAKQAHSKISPEDEMDGGWEEGGGGGGERRGEQCLPADVDGKSHLGCCQHSSSPETKTPPAMTSSGRGPHPLLKTHSIGSVSSESLTISSLWETPSYDTVPDFLSSLGFDDFDSPELIPDRFIPPELNFVRPSLMRQATLGSVNTDTMFSDLSPPAEDLLLGASAVSIDIPDDQEEPAVPPQTLALYLPFNSQLPWQPASLETVAEETGSELLSPRPSSRQSARLTPLVSIDHTPTQDLQWGCEGDVSAGLLGAGLKLRQQSLARDDLRGRQMSLGAESDTSSLYFSVSSHFDDGEKDVETGSGGGGGGGKEGGSGEETDTPSRRRRRGNYIPPPQLLLWLEKSDSAADSTPDQPWPFSGDSAADSTPDQPWPFSEKNSDQSHLHKSLSEPPPPSISINDLVMISGIRTNIFLLTILIFLNTHINSTNFYSTIFPLIMKSGIFMILYRLQMMG